ncbi:MAG TPA: hypothetical protein VLU23_17370 [Pseudolabrys sp.]|jgi:hypothetical protein|nr:hypothetical protein [Pseudolabrys sp.]
MSRRIFAFAITSILSISSVSHAATLSTVPTKNGNIIVTLSGAIIEGDSDTLKSIIRAANSGNHEVVAIRLNSLGGLILEGVKLADIIRDGKISTSIVGSAKCASICFIIFAAGREKYADYAASVGVHGASNESGQETLQSNAVTISMALIAEEFGVPSRIIEKMVDTPPDKLVWLTPDDLRSMGTMMTGKPARLRPTQPPGPPLSPQLRSQEKSAASQRHKF